MEKEVINIIYLILAISYAILKYSGALQTEQQEEDTLLEDKEPYIFPHNEATDWQEEPIETPAAVTLPSPAAPTPSIQVPPPKKKHSRHPQRLKGWKRTILMNEVLRPYIPRF